MPRFSSTVTPLTIPANPLRAGLSLTNEGAGTVYVLQGSEVPSPTNYSCYILVGEYWELPMPYYGPVTFIYGSAGTAMIKEYTVNNSIA
jgi:hypothetical protein